MTTSRALWVAGMAVLCDLIGARVLDALGLIEGLLSPSAASPLLLAPLALVFFAARLTAWFVAPGLLVGALLVSFLAKVRGRV